MAVIEQQAVLRIRIKEDASKKLVGTVEGE